jgi:homoserine O-acetyltransferase/O-succinyltransferase
VNILKSYTTFTLENGAILPEIAIAYHTYGTMNEKRDNVVWVFHALTGNTDAADWWDGLIGEDKILDPSRYFIVCANMLGSCYGATNANSINPLTGKRYGKDFPLVSVRDVVNSHRLLKKHLNINKIYLGIGGSMGGQQVLEWSIMDEKLFENIVVMAAGAKMYPWAIALNETQRMALEADSTLYSEDENAGKKGMEAARAIGLISYRNYETYNKVQRDDKDSLEDFRVKSYQRYQGLKLSNRFTALSYLSVTKTMDSHNVGRNRGGIENALKNIKSNTLIIGIQSDMLFPMEEQIELATHIPNAQLEIIDSPYGHDGFLIEYPTITTLMTVFLEKIKVKKENTVSLSKRRSSVAA